jgi:alkylation response protein AidB-like acyl-CoA dehydrogenase
MTAVVTQDVGGELDSPSLFVPPSPDVALVRRATELRPLIRAHADEGEAQRRIPEPVIEALKDAGLLHIVIPKRLGGEGTNFRTFMEATAEVARADGATGWVHALLNVCTWFVTTYSEQAQQDVFGGHPKALSGAVLAPTRQVRHVDGGIVMSGRWPYATGSWHADWSGLGVVLAEDPDGSPQVGLALVPISELRIEETWDMTGMAATGSNTLVAEEVFVPSHRIQAMADLARGVHAREYTDEPVARASFMPVAGVALCFALLGIARGVLDETLQRVPEKPVVHSVYRHTSDSPAHQMAIAEAASQIDLAYLVAARACSDIDRAAEAGEEVPLAVRARVRMDTGQAVVLCREAIDRLLTVNGPSVMKTGSVIGRLWRDAEVASRHTHAEPALAKQVYGRALFGNFEPVSPF